MIFRQEVHIEFCTENSNQHSADRPTFGGIHNLLEQRHFLKGTAEFLQPCKNFSRAAPYRPHGISIVGIF